MRDNNISDEIAIKLWYSGLGELFHSSRSPLATAGCDNQPTFRKIYYISVGITIAIMSLTLLISIKFMYKFQWLIGIAVIGAIFGFERTILFFRAYYSLAQAVNSGLNTDTNDPLRMETMRKAAQWGIKKGLIYKDGRGNWQINKN